MKVNGLVINNNYHINTEKILNEIEIFNSCYRDIDNKNMIKLSSMIIELFKMIRGFDIYVDNEEITKLLENIKNMYEEIEIPSSFNVYMRFGLRI